MDVDKNDTTVLMYTFGVMLSALWLATPGTPQVTPVAVVLLGVASVAWTGYFRWQIAPQYRAEQSESAGRD